MNIFFLFVSWPNLSNDKLIKIMPQFIITSWLNDPDLLHQRCQFDHYHPTRVDSGIEALTKYSKILLIEQVMCHSMQSRQSNLG